MKATTIMDFLAVKDAYGTSYKTETWGAVIKGLKVKGSSSVAKVGTKVKINRLVDGDHNIYCKVTSIGQ